MISGFFSRERRNNNNYLTNVVSSLSGRAKRNISLAMVILLTVVFCGSIDLNCDSFSSGGAIRGSSSLAAAHSFEAFPSTDVRDDSKGSSGNDQSLGRETAISDILYRIARKLLAIIGCGTGQDSLAALEHFYISICISGCTCLYLLTNIRFIHLKDGSK